MSANESWCINLISVDFFFALGGSVSTLLYFSTKSGVDKCSVSSIITFIYSSSIILSCLYENSLRMLCLFLNILYFFLCLLVIVFPTPILQHYNNWDNIIKKKINDSF